MPSDQSPQSEYQAGDIDIAPDRNASIQHWRRSASVVRILSEPVMGRVTISLMERSPFANAARAADTAGCIAW
jgi:hypothetical protein